jgi:hypothetical protein
MLHIISTNHYPKPITDKTSISRTDPEISTTLRPWYFQDIDVPLRF